MSETDTGTGVERQEDEGVRRQILVQSFVEEAVGVKFKG